MPHPAAKTTPAFDRLTGQTIKTIRYLTTKENTAQGFDEFNGPVIVMFMSNGDQIIVAQDDEFNGPGRLHLSTKTGINTIL